MLVKINRETYVALDDIQSISSRTENNVGYLDLQTYSGKRSHSLESDGDPQKELERIVKEVNDYRTNSGGVLSPLHLPVSSDKE